MEESTILRNYKPFEYKVYNSKGDLEEYSGGFLTEEKALEWYNTQGTKLEELFNRRLVLVENRTYEQISLPWRSLL